MRMPCRNPCACHAKSTLNLQKCSKNPGVLTCFNDFDFQIVLARRRGANFGDFNFKVLRSCHFLTILTSEPFSRAGVVQILATSTSKSAPRVPVFSDLDFQIVFAQRRGANFGDFNFQKCSHTLSFLSF